MADDFFRRFISDISDDTAFTDRHPHFHVRLIPVAALESVEIDEFSGRDLRRYNKALAALLRGDQVDRIVVDVVSPGGGFELDDGAPILQAARDAGTEELRALIRYVSRPVERAWWGSPDVPAELTVATELLTEDEDPILTEDSQELVVE